MSRNFCTLEIDYNDIEKAENLLSNDQNKIKFDENSQKIIKFLDSCFIQACPGSGKTTALVAKLAILADKLHSNYDCVCVLSHTNISKEIIKDKLGDKASKLLKYPNFIGTIQSFVDTYLAIPAMVKIFGDRPKEIDSSKFAVILEKRLPYTTKGYLLGKFGHEYLEKIHYKFEDINSLTINRNLFNTEKTFKHYEILCEKVNIVKKEGYITYDDAFALANWYLQEETGISELISKRFPYVFIDEVQDTSENQLKILTKIFKNSSFQYFGDNNQNLYDPKTDILEKIKEYDNRINDTNILEINDSYRLSPIICNLSQHVCKKVQNLSSGKVYSCGNKKKEDCIKCDNCQNTIILYNDVSIKQVLPLFAQIINSQKQIKSNMGNCFKLIGHIGKEFKPDEKIDSKGVIKISLPDYYDKFLKISKVSGISYSQLVNLKTIFIFVEKYINQNNFKEAKNLLLRGFVKLLNSQNIENIKTVNDLTDYFKGINKIKKLNEFLFFCCNSICNSSYDYEKIKDKIFILLKEMNISQLNNNSIKFINDEAKNFNTSQSIESIDNIYKCPDTGIEIEINTIAGEKGETHDATLLVETYKDAKDLKLFLPFISNKSSSKKYLDHSKLSNLYVAMTRPKHLLCLAMHQDSFDDKYRKDLENLGWIINEELINIENATIKASLNNAVSMSQ